MDMDLSRRGFVGAGAAFFAVMGGRSAWADGDGHREKRIVDGAGGFEEKIDVSTLDPTPWTPFSDRKVRVGIAGEGACDFGDQFGYQSHPNVTVVACTDLFPDRCTRLQYRTGAQKTYPSCEEMIRHAAEDKLDAVYIATDAPSHITLAIFALEHGLNVATAVPAFFGKDQLDLVPKLLDAVKRSGKVYMMNETTAFRQSCYEMRKLYEAGALGRLAYAEGEYWHFANPKTGLGTASYKGWRDGMPPMYYATHSTGFYTCVAHKRFTEVACIGQRSVRPIYADGNAYGNPFGAEFAFLKGEDGAAARMVVSFDIPCVDGERGRVWGMKGGYDDATCKFLGDEAAIAGIRYKKPQLPPGMDPGWHGGSHGYLTDDFIRGILVKDHKVCVDVITALNTTAAGVYAHISAMRGGETLKIPEFSL